MRRCLFFKSDGAKYSSRLNEYKRRLFAPFKVASFALPPYDPLPKKIAHLWLDFNGDGTLDDANDFFSNWRSFFTSAGPAGGYFGTAADVAVWMRAFMSGKMHSPRMLAEAKTTVSSSAPANGRYGLGIMERKFLNLTAYGHGGDIGYSSVCYYFPEKDVSIAVLNNDSKKISWTLAPVIQALLTTCIQYSTVLDAPEITPQAPLSANIYPNPFTNELRATVHLSEPARAVQVMVVDGPGRVLFQTPARDLPEGEHAIALDRAREWPAGMYFIRILADGKPPVVLKVVK